MTSIRVLSFPNFGLIPLVIDLKKLQDMYDEERF